MSSRSRIALHASSARTGPVTRGHPPFLGVVKYFVANMGVPRAFRTDNGAECINSTFVDYCHGLGIRRELTAPYTPLQNGPVESGLSRAINAGHVGRRAPRKTQGSAKPGRLKVMDGVCFVIIRGFNRSTATANSNMGSPLEVFYGSCPPMPVLLFCKPAYHRVPRRRRMDPYARPCFP